MGADPITIVAIIIAVGGAIYANNQIPDDPSDTGADITKQGSQASRNRVYGRCRTSCSNVWSNVNNRDNSKRVDVFSIGGVGKLKKIHQVYISDKQVFEFLDIDYTAPNSTDINEGVFGHDTPKDPFGVPITNIHLSDNFKKQKVSIQFRMGYQQETAMSLPITYGDGEWTVDHRGDTVPQVAIVADRNIKDEGIVIMTDRYPIVVEVTGDDVEDINGNPVDSRNAAYALLDYLTDKTGYGLAISKDYINLQTFAETASFVDTHNLFVNAEVKTENAFSDNILNLLSCFGGSLTINNGLICLLYEDIEISEYSLDRDNIVKDSLTVRPASSQNYYNAVTTTYKSGPNREGEDDFMLPADIINHPDYIEDQEILNKTIKMPYTIDGSLDGAGDVEVQGAVKFLTNREYRKRLFQQTCSLDVDLMDFPNLQIWSVIDVTEPLYNWDKKKFRVLEINSSLNSEQFNIATLTLSEYDDFIYTGIDDGAAGNPPSDGTDVTSPANLTFTQEAWVTDGYGTLSWNPTFFSLSAEYDVQYKLSSEESWTTAGKTSDFELKISNLKPTNYDFRVRVNDYLLGTSNWAQISETVISPPSVLPSVKNLAADFSTKTVFVTWDSILDEPLGGTSTTDPNSGGATGTVKDVFSHYLVNISEATVDGGAHTFVKGYTVTEPKFDYTFDDNSKNGTGASRYIKAEVTVVSKTNSSSPIESVEVENSQMPQPSGVSVSGEFGQMFLSWDVPTQNDYFKTLVYASKTNNFTPSTANKIGEVLGGSHFNYLFEPDDPNVPETFYVKFVHRDYFQPIDGLAYSAQIQFTTQSLDTLLPDFPSELADIRDPNRQQTSTGEMIMNVASENKRVVTGYGMYAKDSGDSLFIIAANEFVVASGGYAQWDENITYSSGDKVSFHVDDSTQSTWIALRETTGDSPPSSPSDWDMILANSFQSAFYIDSESEQLLIRTATIEDLNASKITTGTLGAAVIYGGVIQGGQIASDSRVTAGSGEDIAALDGADALWRLYAGSSYSNRATAPFRVDKDGKLYANSAEIEGKVTMTSGGVAGWKIDANNIYSGATPQTNNQYDTNGITLSSSGGIRSRFFRVDTNGDAFFSGNISGAFGTFSGNIQAAQILGDIVTAITKTTTERVQSSVGDTSAMVTFNVVTARPYDRTMVISGFKINLDIGDVSTTTPTRAVLVVSSSDTSISDVLSAELKSNAYGSSGGDMVADYFVDNLTIEVPANTSPSISVLLRVLHAGSGATFLDWTAEVVDSTALLYTTGGDLS